MGRIREWFRGWRLVSWRSAVVAAVLLYTLIGFFVAPAIVKKLAVDNLRELTGREVEIDAVRVNPYTLSLTVRGFHLPDRPGTTLLAFDELYANAQLSSLFRWAITLKEFRLDNPHVELRRFEDGQVNVVELIEEVKRRSPQNAEPAAPGEDDEGGIPRTLLQYILVTGATIDVEDRANEETVGIELGPSRLELRGISTIPGRKGDHEFAIGLQRGGTIGVSGDVVVEPLGLDGSVTIDKLLFENTWPLLQAYFEFELKGGQVAGHFRYSVRLEDDGLHARIDDLDYRLSKLELDLRDTGTRILVIDEVDIEDGRLVWPEGEVGASEIAVKGADAFAWLETDGRFGWERLVPKPTQEQVVKTYHQVEEAVAWKATVDRLRVEGAGASFEDRTFDPPVSFSAGNANLVLTDVTTEPESRWGVTASVTLMDQAAATAKGSFGAVPVALDAEVGINDLDLALLQPYVGRLLPVELRAGRVASSGSVAVALAGDGPMAEFTGDVEIDEIDLWETAIGSRILRWGRVEVSGIDATHQPLALAVDAIDIHGAGVDLLVSEDGKINVLEMLAVMAERKQETQETGGGDNADDASDTEPQTPSISVGKLALHGCSGGYTDRTLTPPFTLGLEQVDGTVVGIDSEETAGANVDIGAQIASGGGVDIGGEIDPFDPARLTDLTIDVRQVAIPPMSPMAVRYIGHPVDNGSADLGFTYEIVDKQLTGGNRIVTQDLELGERVEGDRALDLPVKLGVSLLTDRSGRMTLDFPIEGNLDDPGFGLGTAVGSAVKEITSELVKSPFRMLGKLGGGGGGGGDGQDYGYVEFPAGSSELDANSQTKLRTLAAGFAQRPRLALRVAGVWDPAADTPALKEAALEEALARRGEAEEATDTAGSSTPVERLEALYREQLSAEELEAVRARHTTAPDTEGEAPRLDETAYYRELRQTLIDAQPVDRSTLVDLATARGEAVRELLIEALGTDTERIELLDPLEIDKPAEDRWVRLTLDVAATD